MNIVRILEVIIGYYIICHVVACLFISIALHETDVRTTWLRRVPVPQAGGFRESPTMDDTAPQSIYIHALLFAVNTISHVAIGELTTVTVNERAFNAFIILVGTFVYALLFGNIAAMVADFAPHLFIQFQENY